MARVLSSWDEAKPGALAAMQATRDVAAGKKPVRAKAKPVVEEEPAAEEPAEEEVEDEAEEE